MALLLLAACGYPSYYPTPGAAISDSAALHSGMPCGADWTFDTVELRVTATAATPLDLYQVHDSCAETLVGPLEAHSVLTTTAFPGNVFSARDRTNGVLYDWLRVEYGEPMVAWEVR